jgi:hypothetical protein
MQSADGLGTGAFVAAALLLVAGARPTDADERAGVAFFYGSQPSAHALGRFREVVVEPAGVGRATLARLQSTGTAVHAYLSVGERRRDGADGEPPPDGVLGANEAWQTLVVDPASDLWRERLVKQAQSLAAEGYDGLFLDTVDSFRRFVTEPSAVEHRWRSLAELVRSLHRTFPGLRLLLNRGFELLPEVAPCIDAVVAESLFRGWDPVRRRYVEVASDDRAWLAARLREARDRYGLEAIAIDYVPADAPALARRTARAIAGLGFVPYVATPALDTVGVGPPSTRGGRRRSGR